MSHRVSWTGSAPLLLVALAAACSDSTTDPGPGSGPGYTPVRIPQPNTDPIVLHDNVVVIDSTVLRMASTETEISAGTYRFDVVGSPVPLIEAGDVVVGVEGLGFMGVATTISYGTRVVVQATQAYLVDVIKEASLHGSVPLDFSAASPSTGSTEAPYLYLAPGIKPTGRVFEIKDVDLCELAKKAGLAECPEGLSLTLPSGYVDLTGEGDYGLDVRCCVPPVDSFAVSVEGQLVFDVVAKAVATRKFETGGEVVLVSTLVPIPVPLGAGKVIKLGLRVSLKAGWNAGAEVEARVQSGAHLETGVKLGGKWTYDKWNTTKNTPDWTGWTPIWDPTFSAETKETFWAAQGSGFVRIYVRPDVQFVLLGFEGPRAGIEPNLKLTGTAGTESCNMRLTRSTDANVELFAHFLALHYTTDTLKVPFPGQETDLIPPIPCPLGHLKVVATTTGSGSDADGYTVTLDGTDPKPIPINGSVTYSPLPPTTYIVELTDMAENCSVTNNPREINVSEGDTTLVAFPVTCGDPQPTTGAIKVNTMTTGQDDGYSIVLDGDVGGAMPVGTVGSVTFGALAAGDHTVELIDEGANCLVWGDNPRTVAVANVEVETTFDVACGLAVTVATTGPDPDPDGYDVVVDAGAPARLADINGSLWLDIAPGMHGLELADLADGCTVAGDNPRDVTAPGAETFDVSCTKGETGGSITYKKVFAYDLFQINADGTGEQQITSNGFDQQYEWHAWSPDGTRIVYQAYRQCGAISSAACWAIYVADDDGSNEVQLTYPIYIWPDSLSYTQWTERESDESPRWSPDGTRIVYHRLHEDSQDGHVTETHSIRTIDPDGSNETVVASTGDYAITPTWAPDGSIVYAWSQLGSCDFAIKRINADGTGDTVVRDFGCQYVYQPRVSPDGTRIAVQWTDLDGTQDLWTLDADGSNLTDLTQGAYDYLQMGDWSPGGGRFVFTHINAGPGIDNVWTINADGTNPQQVTSGFRAYQPQWRPEP